MFPPPLITRPSASKGFLGALLMSTGCFDYGLADADSGHEEGDPDEWAVHAVGPRPESCNGHDDDLDGEVDEDFPDSDGNGVPDCRDVERCDGVDNDGDGRVDDGFQDLDGDGTADCVDAGCDLSASAGHELPPVGSCASRSGVPPREPWDVVVVWEWAGVRLQPDARETHSLPVIANLTDDNGDGRVDGADTPDIVVVAFSGVAAEQSGHLVVLDGATGTEHWAMPGFLAGRGPILVRADGQDAPDIIAALDDEDWTVVCLDAAGVERWRQSEVARSDDVPAVVDIDGDGTPEILVGGRLLDGLSGEGRGYFGLTPSLYGSNAAADLDGDGTPEVLLNGSIWRSDASFWWESGVYAVYTPINAAIIDVDGDAAPEIVFAGTSDFSIAEHDGTRRTAGFVDAGATGPLCAADFDGDGLTEIAIPTQVNLELRRLDGTLVWSVPTSDASSAAGCSGYDLDGDGAHEILYADEVSFRILDGRSGAALYVDDQHRSRTATEYPTVADLDGDGSVEIVVSNSSWEDNPGRTGVTVYGHRASGWVAGGRGWPVHDWTGTNVLEDGTVPAHPAPWWQGDNVYRAGPVWGVPRPDLSVEVTDSCLAGCEAESLVRLSVQVSNRASVATRDTVPLSVYRLDGADRTLLRVLRVGPVPATTALPAIVVEVPRSDLGSDGLLLRVGDLGTGALPRECDRSDNEVVWQTGLCGAAP